MRHINPHTLYDSNELHDLIRGVVKIETLRHYGLVGSPGSGYWGQNVIDAVNNYWNNLVRQRGTSKVMNKENHLGPKTETEIFDNGKAKVQDRQVHSASGRSDSMESQRERFRRQVSENQV